VTHVEAPTAAPREPGARPADIGLVSVVVPHLDDYDNLDACLSLLAAQTFPSQRTEIIIADNGSSRGLDAVREIVGARARVIAATERGAGPARNAGVHASLGDALAFLDSDCRPDPRWLEEGLAELKRADFVGGRVDVLVADSARMTAAEAFESVFAFRNDRYVNKLNFTVTASMFVWRSVFDAVGGFENGVPEDLDWCQRAGRKGYRICYAPNAIVGHPARRNMAELKRKWRRLTLESCEAARRDGKGAAATLLRQWAALFAVAPQAVAPLTSPRLSGVTNRLMAVGALAYIRAYRLAIAHGAVLRPSEK
jgi:GT2 family glycosyltransferase